MIKRTLVFSKPAYLSIKDEQIMVRYKDTGETRQAPVEDVGVMILENDEITISLQLIRSLGKNNVAVVFCNEKHMPASVLQNLDCNSVQQEVTDYSGQSRPVILG